MPDGSPHYMPRPDGNFDTWTAQYSAAVHTWWELNGLDPALLVPLEKALQLWQAKYPAHVTAQAAAEAARAAKEAARIELENEVRPLTNFIQSFPTTTDANRAEIGITVRKAGRRPAPPPASRPVVQVLSDQRLTHRVRFTDESTPTRHGKPKGTMGAEVWRALTLPGFPPPMLNSNAPGAGDPYKFLSVSFKGTLQTEFPTEDAGKTAYYALRWISTRGEQGPWSEVASATVAA